MFRAALLLVLALAAFLAQAAMAAKPLREDLPSETFTYPVEVCGFEVLQEATANKGKQLTFSDGRQLATGVLKLRLTNLETGESIALNASGPGTFITEGDVVTVRARGPWVIALLPGEPTGPGLFYYKGNTTFTVDPAAGVITSITSTGTPRDLCAELS
jgi:hypothetical protein